MSFNYDDMIAAHLEIINRGKRVTKSTIIPITPNWVINFVDTSTYQICFLIHCGCNNSSIDIQERWHASKIMLISHITKNIVYKENTKCDKCRMPAPNAVAFTLNLMLL